MKPGDIVAGAFPGAHTAKIRPMVVISTVEYNRARPDVIASLLTTRSFQLGSTDYILKDWRLAGLDYRSTFRVYVVTLLQRELKVIGKLTDHDWSEVRGCLQRGLIGGDNYHQRQ